MARKKPGICGCQHEIGYWHDKETGRCMYGSGVNGAGEPHPPKSIAGGCPCVRKVKAKEKRAMKGTTKTTTRTITVDGARVLDALDQIIGGLQIIRAEVARGKVSKEVPAMLTAPRESPAGGVPSRSTNTNGTAAAGAQTPGSSGGADSELGVGPREVLEALSQWGGSADLSELVIATGKAPRTVSDYLSELSAAGLVTRSRGRAALVGGIKGVHQKPSRVALQTYWCSALGSGQSAVLRALIAAGGRASTAEIARKAEVAERTASDYLSELSRWRLLKRSNGVATLHRELGGPS